MRVHREKSTRRIYMALDVVESWHESSLHSVDLGFAEKPATLIPADRELCITSFHVTEDFIYFGVVNNIDGQGAIMRADLDGRNARVLADGFETGHRVVGVGAKRVNNTGEMSNIMVAGEWMMFCQHKQRFRPCLAPHAPGRQRPAQGRRTLRAP